MTPTLAADNMPSRWGGFEKIRLIPPDRRQRASATRCRTIKATLPGFGMEIFADPNNGGSWHVGFLGAPGIPSLILPGREHALIADWAYANFNGTEGAVTEADLVEFIRSYSRAGGWRGTESLYRAVFTDKGAIRALAEAHPIEVPVLTVDAVNHPLTSATFKQVSSGQFSSVHFEGIGHLVAQESPEKLAAAFLNFVAGVDRD